MLQMMYMEGFEQSPVVSILNVVINIVSNEKLISLILTNAYMYFIPYQYIGYIHCSNNSTKKTWNNTPFKNTNLKTCFTMHQKARADIIEVNFVCRPGQ